MILVLSFTAALTLLLALFFAVLAASGKPSAETERLMTIVSARRTESLVHSSRERFESQLSAIVLRLRNAFGVRSSDRLRERLASAGIRSMYASDMFSAVQWLVPLLGAVGATFLHENVLFWAFVLGGIAYLLPGIWLSRRINMYKETLRRSLPDTMDLLVICVDAGLGMDQALIRVTEELTIGHREIQQEFHRIQLEQRAGSPRLEAWKRFAARVQIDEINSFVSMLSQADRFGTPIARALNRFAEDLRTKRRHRAEEAAAKTKVKIVFPLVFFIFPCLFIVLLAPAIMGIMSAFQQLH
jgi:tight adherence protein C